MANYSTLPAAYSCFLAAVGASIFVVELSGFASGRVSPRAGFASGLASGGFETRGRSFPTGTGTVDGRSPGATGPCRGPGSVKRGGAEDVVGGGVVAVGTGAGGTGTVFVGAPGCPGAIGGVIGPCFGPAEVPLVLPGVLVGIGATGVVP